MNYLELITHSALVSSFIFCGKVFRSKAHIKRGELDKVIKVDRKYPKYNSLSLCSAIVFCFAIFLPYNSFAITPDQQREIEQRDIQIKQGIESERQNLIHEKEAEEIQNIDKGKIKEEKKLKQLESERADRKACLTIKEFEFIGNKEISNSNLRRKFIIPLQKSRTNSCFTKEDLTRLHDQIGNYYIDYGYIISRVYIDISEINKKIIKIVIEEGKLERLEIQDNSKLNDIFTFRRGAQKFFAFPSLWKDEAVNIRNIEQGIDQINRLSSQNAKASFDPAKKEGYSNVIIENQIGHQAIISLGVDNSGNQRTGRIKRKASLNYDNFLGIGDNIYLNYSESNSIPLFGSSKGFNNKVGTDDNSNNRFSKAFYGAASLPFGYWTFGASYSYSKYLLTSSGIASTIKSSGNSESKTYYLDRVISRGKKYKISLKTELGQNDTDSYLEDTYIPVNSRKTTEANLYLNNTFYLSNSTLYFQPKYSKGLTAFGAIKDARGLAADKSRAQFETFGLYAQSSLNFNIPKTTAPLNHKLTFDSLKSKDSLYGLDQFSLGGRYTIRGFQQSIISGDNGYSIKNDLSARLSDLLPGSLLVLRPLNYGGENLSIHSAISKLRFGIFHDYGYVRNHVIDSSSDEGYMSGAGAILSFSGQFINWDVTYSKGLHSPQYLRNLDNIPKDNETIYFSLGLNFGIL